MSTNHSDTEDRSPKIRETITWIIGTIVAVLGIVTAVNNISNQKKPIITVENKLALPIVVTVNDSHRERILAGKTQTITLLSAAEFPARVVWKVERNKNNLGQPLGEELGEEIKFVDQSANIIADNEIGISTYFYPVILNNTDSKCTIVVNDGLQIQYVIGESSPHKTANITGYYKYATNSNVTLKCPDNTYWRGKRNGQKGPAIDAMIGSGVVEIPIP